MKTRLLSALVIIAIGMTGIILGGYWLSALVLFITAVGLYEFYRAFENKEYHPVKTVGFIYVLLLLLQVLSGSSAMGELYFTGAKSIAHINWFPLIQLLILLILLALSVIRHDHHNIADGAVTIMGGYYVVYLSSYFLSLRNLPGGVYLFVMVLLGCVASDTFAYLVGSRFGRHKLIPAVSPNKTVEGSVGAFAGATVLVTAYGLVMTLTGVYEGVRLFHYPILGFLMGGLAQIGDLVASSIKRYTGVKDFGKLIPGHGGILDRVDSYLFVFPIMYYYLALIGISL